MQPQQDQNEMRRMQQDAVRRVQEMQNRARQAVDPSRIGKDSGSGQASPANRENQPPHSSQETPVPASQLQGKGMSGILDTLMQDSERTLILVLILLLSSEKADMELLLALMYLII